MVAGIGGMSEFSMMTHGIPWPVSYGIFTLCMAGFGWLTYIALQRFGTRKNSANLAASRAKP